jgi:hypothetical protein
MQWEVVRDANEQQALGACVGSFQGHVISLSLRGWHLSHAQPSYLSSSTDYTGALQQFGVWSPCHGSYPALWPVSTKA